MEMLKKMIQTSVVWLSGDEMSVVQMAGTSNHGEDDAVGDVDLQGTNDAQNEGSGGIGNRDQG